MKFTQDIKLSISLTVKDMDAIKEALSLKGLPQEEIEEILEDRFTTMMEAFVEEIEAEYSGGDENQEVIVKADYL